MPLRLVKVTVNFDAPDTYHLYFGGGSGQPGTLITFFPWPGAPRGRRGAGQATTVSFSVPEGSLGWWRDHLQAHAIEVGTVVSRAEEEALSVRDPDGWPAITVEVWITAALVVPVCRSARCVWER